MLAGKAVKIISIISGGAPELRVRVPHPPPGGRGPGLRARAHQASLPAVILQLHLSRWVLFAARIQARVLELHSF